MKKSLLLMGGAKLAPGQLKDAADFDGTNDYLSRASDFTGNTDSKTATFVFWIYRDDNALHTVYDANGKFTVQVNASNQVVINGKNSASTTILSATVTATTIAEKTFYPVHVSFDLANAANRGVYIADESATVTWTTYTNDLIDFTETEHAIGALVGGGSKTQGRLSNVFLDYTYRDPSVEGNRRLFTEFGDNGLQPTSTQASLNPILYAPLNDETQFFVNEGTGGNFVQNGTMAKSQVGPSDYSAAASEIDGVNDVCYTNSIIGATDGKQFTFSCSFNRDNAGGVLIGSDTAASNYFRIWSENGGGVRVQAFTGSGVSTLLATTTISTLGKTHSIQISVDMSNPSNRHFIVDGEEAVGLNWITYNDNNLEFTPDSWTVGGLGASSPYSQHQGMISDVYLDDSYLDISSENPFYDAEANKPKYLGEQGELPTGSQPLVYLPMRADDAGDNRGSGGDFTVNSGPFVGARGPSEYLARSIVVDGTDYLAGSVFCQSLVKWVDTGAGWNVTYANAVTVTDIGNGTDNGEVAYYFGTSENINWGLEENTLRFTDAFGYPIAPTIDANTVLFLDFTDSANFGFNKGTGGNYTVNGAPASGADVTP